MRAIRTALIATAVASGQLSLGGVAQAEEKKIPGKTIKSECKAADGNAPMARQRGWSSPSS